jgi:ABC-2 type transport system ATP-binding protein
MSGDDVPAVRIDGLEVGYGKRLALRGATLAVPRGSTTVLLGPNGAGKTTLLRTCAGLLKPRAGRVSVLGLDPVRARDEVCARLGFVPDRPDAWPWMTIEHLLAWLAPHHPRWNEAIARAWVERLEVPRDVPFRDMSRGQGTKAMLAATLAHEPEVLLLDEPFGGLDPLVHDEVLAGVVRSLAESKTTVLLSTHDLDVAARIGDRVAVLVDGRVRRETGIDDLVGGRETARKEALRGVLAAAVDDARP